MADLTPIEKSQLQEVADLMLEIYRTLVRMRYLEAEWIQEGPHDISHLMPLYKSQSLDPAIIYLYSILPYVDNAGVEPVDFFQGSYFGDFRKEDDVVQGRNPFDSEEDEGLELMKPWMTPLSLLGSHRSVIIYSARKHRVWIIDQESWSSFDHAFSSEAIYEAAEDLGDDGEGTDGDKGDDDEEIDEANREGVYDETDSRPAGEVLRDIVRWYKTLKETPGGGDNSLSEWSEDVVRPLYIEHGWPSDNFDGDAFEADHARAEAVRELKWRAEEPLRKVLQAQSSGDENQVVRMREQLASAKTVDEEWLARWTLWHAEKAAAYKKDSVRRAEKEAERLCPGGRFLIPEELPLWEEKRLRIQVDQKKAYVEEARKGLNEARLKHIPGSASLREAELGLAYAEKQAAVYQRAYESAKADAERLCPGKTITSPIGLALFAPIDFEGEIRRAAEGTERSRRELGDLREWAANLPEGADKARVEVGLAIQVSERTIKSFEEREAAWVKARDQN